MGNREWTRKRGLPVLLLLAVVVGCAEENPGSFEEGTGGIDPDLLVELTEVYSVMPEIGSCNPGLITPAEQAEAIDYINSVRLLHDLPPVVHDPSHDLHAREAALIIAANDYLSHNPPDTLDCWSPDGRLGSQKSNLAWAARLDGEPQKGFTSTYMIDTWWKDSAIEMVGHRRWLLDPFLREVSFGRVDRPGNATNYSITAAALWVIDDDRSGGTSFTGDFVAFPYHDYPSDLFTDGLSISFSAVVDHDDYWANQGVDLTDVAVTILDEANVPIRIRNLRTTVDAFGIPNAVIWDADLQQGVRYTVRVEGIRYEGVAKDYTYWFRLR